MKIVNIENFLLLIGTLVITASVALVTKKQREHLTFAMSINT
jgi:hypothetical protein